MTSAEPSRFAGRLRHCPEPPHSITPAPQVNPAPNALSSTRAPGPEQPIVFGRDEAKRQRGRRGVAKVLDAVHDALGRELKLFRERAQNPAVGLVVDEQVDVLEREPGSLDRCQRRLAHPRHRVAVDLGPVHPQLAVGVGDLDRGRAGAVGAEHDRADRAELSGCGTEHDRAGAVAEQRRGPLVVPVDDPRGEIGADQEHALGASGLDLSRAERQPRQEPRAGGAEVDCAGAVGADRRGPRPARRSA